jgi:hypothetical protein
MSCCGSLFVNLGGGGGGTVNTGVLQIAGGVALDSSLRFVEDQNGTDSPLKLSTDIGEFVFPDTSGITFKQFSNGGVYAGLWDTKIVTKNSANLSLLIGNTETYINASSFILFSINGVSAQIGDISVNGFRFGGGTHTSNGFVSIKGAGANIVSLRNSSNVEQCTFDNNGNLFYNADYKSVGKDGNNSIRYASGEIRVGVGGSGNIIMYDSGNARAMLTMEASGFNYFGTAFSRLAFGGTTTDFPAIAATNTPATLSAKDATNTNLIPFSAEDFTSANLSAGTLNTARPMQFGDKGTVTTGNDLGLDAQIAVEHNGNVYYIPCSTVLLT